MITLSDRYGDLMLEDVEEFETLAPDDEKPIDFDGTFQRGETRSFEADFGHQLEEALAILENSTPEWDEYDEAEAQTDYEAYHREAE